MTILDMMFPAYVLALFDEVGDGGDGGAAGATAVADPAAGASASGNGGTAPRNTRGQFIVPSTNDPAELQRVAIDAANAANTANDQIANLKADNLKRKQTEKELRATLDGVTARQASSDQRAIRGEVRAALVTEGVIDPDVLDIFLRHAGDKIKIDPATGDVVGIAESLASYKTAKPVFFKAAAAAMTGAEGAAAGADGAAGRANATSTGASPSGGADTGSGTTTGGLPDLRGLDPKARRTALAAYKASLRSR